MFSYPFTSLVEGGPAAERDPFTDEDWLSIEGQCREAIMLMKHTYDEATVKEKMTVLCLPPKKMVHDPQNSDILSVSAVPEHARHGMYKMDSTPSHTDVRMYE